MCRLAIIILLLVSITYPIGLGTADFQVSKMLLSSDNMMGREKIRREFISFTRFIKNVKLASSLPSSPRMSIELGSDEDPDQISKSRSAVLLRNNPRIDDDSFCTSIHQAIPKEVKDGKFIIEPDLSSSSDMIAPVALAPLSGFIPKMGLPKIKPPRLGVPTLKVPQLKYLHRHLKAPKVGKPMLLLPWRREDESSAEKVERFKKGVQKMLNFVKIIGKIDKYLSERTRIVVDKLSKTFAE